MYHTVYLITNHVNGKIYVGVHSTFNLEDGYMGSSKLVDKAIIKYGQSNFTKQILHFAYDRDHAYDIEAQIVDSYFVHRKDTYNMHVGGTTKYLLNGTKTCKSGSTYKNIYGEERSKEILSKRKNTKIKNGNVLQGQKYPDHMKKNLSEYRKSYKMMYNLDLLISKHVKHEDIESYLLLGWILGRVPKRLKSRQEII